MYSIFGYLFTDIISKGLPSFKQTYVELPVTYNKDTIEDSSYAIDEKHYELVSRAWYRDMPKYVEANPQVMNKVISEWVLADDEVDQYMKGHQNSLSEEQKLTVKELAKQGKIDQKLNIKFLTGGDSKMPENSGFLSSVVGSILTILVCIVFAFPIGVMSAIYLEEFKKDNKISRS